MTIRNLILSITMLAVGCADAAHDPRRDDGDADRAGGKTDDGRLMFAAESFAGHNALNDTVPTACTYTLTGPADNGVGTVVHRLFVNTDDASSINIGLEFPSSLLPLANGSTGQLYRGYEYRYDNLVLTIDREKDGQTTHAQLVVTADLAKIYSATVRKVDSDAGDAVSFVTCGF